MDVRERSEILYNISKILKTYVYDIAYIESLQSGRPLREMNAQLLRLPEWFEYYASYIRIHEGKIAPFKGNYLNYIERVPLGLILQITPWNHPMLISIKKIAPALAAGNCIIVKPSELAPCSILEFGNICKQGGLPNGVLNIIPGIGSETGKYYFDKEINGNMISKVDLTGGTQTGIEIGSQCGKNLMYYTAELGGKSPIIIFKDFIESGDNQLQEEKLEQIASGCCFASFIATGQTCIMGSRLLIEDTIYDKVINKIKNKIDKQIMFNKNTKNVTPQNLQCQFGPVISKQQRDKIIKFIDKCKNGNGKEGNILIGGNIPNNDNNPNINGYYFEPTLIGDCNPNMSIVQEEIFGPVVVAMKFKSGDKCEESAINMANNSSFGLAASIWTSNISRAYRICNKLNVGIIWINDHHRNDPSSPWGGMKLSGIGRENGIDAFNQYTQTKSVIINCNHDDKNKNFDWFVNNNNVRYS